MEKLEVDLRETDICWNRDPIGDFIASVNASPADYPEFSTGKIACQGCISDGDALCTAQFNAGEKKPIDPATPEFDLSMVTIPGFRLHVSDRPYGAGPRSVSESDASLDQQPTTLTGKLLKLFRFAVR